MVSELFLVTICLDTGLVPLDTKPLLGANLSYFKPDT